MAQPVVGVVGAKALRRDLNRLISEVNGPLFNAMKRAGYAAVQPIVALVRGALPKSERKASRTHRPGALMMDVRASGTQSGGSVRMGRKTIPYAGWVEFGGTRPDGSEREFVRGGRYMFPAAKGDASRAGKAYSDALTALFGNSGIWTNTTDDGGNVHD